MASMCTIWRVVVKGNLFISKIHAGIYVITNVNSGFGAGGGGTLSYTIFNRPVAPMYPNGAAERRAFSRGENTHWTTAAKNILKILHALNRPEALMGASHDAADHFAETHTGLASDPLIHALGPIFS